jgi:hypothetical protein
MQRLEAAGYSIVLHVHDEIVCEARIEFGSTEEFRNLITTLPDWAAGLPIAAKVRNGQRFAKSEKPTVVENPENLGGPKDSDTAANEPGAGTKTNGSGAQRAGNYPRGERRGGRLIATYLYRNQPRRAAYQGRKASLARRQARAISAIVLCRRCVGVQEATGVAEDPLSPSGNAGGTRQESGPRYFYSGRGERL